PLPQRQEHAVVNGVPLRVGLEVHGEIGIRCAWQARCAANRGRTKIGVFASGLPIRIVQHLSPGGAGLIHVQEATKAQTAHAKVGGRQIPRGVRFNFNTRAKLIRQRRLMIARESDDHGVSKESAAREKARRTAGRPRADRIRIGAVAGRWVEQVWPPQQIIERQVRDEWGTGESKQPRRGVQIVLFGFTSWEFARRAAARRDLARKQRRRNRTVKEATAAANDGLPPTAGVIGEPNARVPIIKVVVQRFGGPRFPFVSKAEVHREAVCDSGLVLNKQSVIRMGQYALRLISYCFGDGAAEIHRAVDRRLRECRYLESLEEDDKRRSVDQIVQRCKRCLERIKKWER